MELSIIIVNWNVREHLSRCLVSIGNNAGGDNIEIIVVDNASSDGSCAMVEKSFPRVKLIQNSRNLGYPAANNQGLRVSRGRYKLLLNPDILVRRGSIERMVAFMDSHPEVGVCGGALFGVDGERQGAYNRSFPDIYKLLFYYTSLKWRFPSNRWLRSYLMLEMDQEREQEIDQPAGACMMIRKEVLERVGLMDERFFLFFNEVDLCFRVKKAGWKIYYLPTAEFDHVGKASWSRLKDGISDRYAIEGAALYLRKHFSIAHSLLFKMAVRVDRLFDRTVAA